MAREDLDVAAGPVPAPLATEPAATSDAARSSRETAVAAARAGLAAANDAFAAALDRHAPLVELQEFDAEVTRAAALLDDARSARQRGSRAGRLSPSDGSRHRDLPPS